MNWTSKSAEEKKVEQFLRWADLVRTKKVSPVLKPGAAVSDDEARLAVLGCVIEGTAQYDTVNGAAKPPAGKSELLPFQKLEARHVVQHVCRTCTSHPAQWAATTIDGREVYVRFRNGFLYVNVGEPNQEVGLQRGPQTVFQCKEGEGGEMEYEEMCALTAQAIRWPAAENEQCCNDHRL